MIGEQVKGYLIGGIAIAFTISLAGNAWLYDQVQDANAAAAQATQRETDARTAADICSASVDRLQEVADARAAAAAPVIAAAKDAEVQAGASAQVVMMTPPSTPDNDCKSATDMAEKWLKGRKR